MSLICFYVCTYLTCIYMYVRTLCILATVSTCSLCGMQMPNSFHYSLMDFIILLVMCQSGVMFCVSTYSRCVLYLYTRMHSGCVLCLYIHMYSRCAYVCTYVTYVRIYILCIRFCTCALTYVPVCMYVCMRLPLQSCWYAIYIY